MSQVSLLQGRAGSPSTTLTRYASLNGNYIDNTFGATAAGQEQVAADAGTISNFSVSTGSTAPGTGKSWTMTITKNGVTTSVVVVIQDTNTSAQDTTHSVSFVAGDTMGVQLVPSGTPTTASFNWGMDVTGSGQVLFTSYTISAAQTKYYGVAAAGIGSTTATTGQSVMPTDGSFTLAQILASAGPGVGKNCVYTFVKNGVDTAMTATLSGSSTTASYSGSISASAGDIVQWRAVNDAGSTLTGGSIGIQFSPTTAGESIQCSSVSSNLATSGNNMMPFTGGSGSASTVEANRGGWCSNSVYTLKKLRLNAISAPGGSASWTGTIRSNASNTAVTCSMSGASTTAADTSNSASSVANALLTINIVGASTPTAAIVQAAFVAYIAPANNYVQNLSDSTTPSDATAKTVGKAASDTATLADARSKSVAHFVADNTTTSDAAMRAAAHLLTDSITTTDALVKNITHVIADSASPTDHFDYSLGAGPVDHSQHIADIVAVSDRIVIKINGRSAWYVRAPRTWEAPNPHTWYRQN